MYAPFLSRDCSVGVFINAYDVELYRHDILADGATLLFPSMTSSSALHQKLVINKKNNKTDIEKNHHRPICSLISRNISANIEQ